MVGDDIISDIKGAQECGIRGIQVRTGKYRYYNIHKDNLSTVNQNILSQQGMTIIANRIVALFIIK